MKKYAIAIALTLFSTVSFANSPAWVKVAGTGELDWYLDKASVNVAGNTVYYTAVVKTVQNYNDAFSHFEYQLHGDCSNQSFALLNSKGIGADGGVMSEQNANSQWKSAKPGSALYVVLEAACYVANKSWASR